MAERKEWWEILRDQFASRGLLDPESERIQEAERAAPAVQRQARGLLSLDPQAESDTVLEMGLGSLPGTGQLMALRDLERARRAKDPGAAAMAASNFIPFGTLLNRFRRGPISELDVYHGTPHRFPGTEANPLGEFDASKIGTGEGAQAYGHGVYLAENPGVASGYKSRLSASSYIKDSAPVDSGVIWHKAADVALKIGKLHPDNAGQISSQIMDWVDSGKKPETFLRFNKVSPQLQPAYEAAVKEYAGAIKNTGSLYKADLPDEMIDRMLDWDKPINQQSAAVQGALKFEVVKDPEFAQGLSDSKWLLKLNNKVINGYDTRKEAIMSANESTAGQIFNTMNQTQSPSKVAEFYKNAGIPGIRYLDAGSRGQGGSGTRNFVVFPGEEKKVKILERK